MTEQQAPDAARASIEALFGESAQGQLHMRLPDGGLGRPGGHLHELTYIEARPRRLLIELSGHILLVVTEPAVEEVSHGRVTLGFRQLTCDWQELASFRPHATTYDAGQLSFWSPGLDLLR